MVTLEDFIHTLVKGTTQIHGSCKVKHFFGDCKHNTQIWCVYAYVTYLSIEGARFQEIPCKKKHAVFILRTQKRMIYNCAQFECQTHLPEALQSFS